MSKPHNQSPGEQVQVGRFAALHAPRYRSFWLGSLASIAGVQLMTIAQGWLVYELSGSPLDLGLLGAATAIPTIIVTLFGGVLADRLDKRKVLIATSALAGVFLLVLTVLDYTNTVVVAHVLIIASLIGLVTGLDWPARQAIFPSLIERHQMMSAVALNSILWQSTRMAVPAIGGILIAASDTSVAFLISTIGMIYMVLVLLRLRPDPETRSQGASLHQLLEGFRFIVHNRLFAVLIPLTWVSMFFAISFIQIMPAFADLLDVGEKGFGFLISAFGVGSVLGTIIISAHQQTRRLGWVMVGGMIISAASLLGFAAVTYWHQVITGAFYWALLCAFVAGLFHSFFLISSMTVLQLLVPHELRGRVMGIHGITFSLIPLGGLFVGALAAVFSSPIATGIGALIALSAGIWVAVTQVEVRNFDATQY